MLLAASLGATALLAAPALAQVQLAPATPLADSDVASVLPSVISHDGVIAGTRIARLPPLASCDSACERARRGSATDGFVTRAREALTRLPFGKSPVAINGEYVVTQDRINEGYPFDGPVATQLSTKQRTPIPTFGGRNCLVMDLDARGRVLCGLTDPTALPASVPTVSYLYDLAADRITPLVCPGSALLDRYRCNATAMNDAELIVGTFNGVPIFWEGHDRVVRLPGSERFRAIRVVDVNARGTILGMGEDRERRWWVLYWDATVSRVLHVVAEGTAHAINDHDVVAGSKLVHRVLDPDLDGPVPGGVERAYEPRATLFDLRSGQVIELPGLSESDLASEALDINNAGVAVGRVDARGVAFAPYQGVRSY